ncbi:uncharacterized protein PRCAT00000132001 [Priceomyces carsonii]|uniref:uncharacterized protein n=1 Tax=Priceomyces carsonii TaxID=28549 RepID=UPI002ED9D958|nr:unnamed protein product [Priceomyces carsonii]
MSTPAEIIAARVNGSHLTSEKSFVDLNSPSDSDGSESARAGSPDDHSMNTSVPSISDESAFPALGGKRADVANATPTWGPKMDSAGSGDLANSLSKTSSPSIGSGKIKSSTIQEAFSLGADDQLNVARPEFIKILTYVKSETNTSIECTTSHHTKKRTFLITGKPTDVKLAKRLIIKDLTKPVKISFSVPAKIRSRIIGQQGRTLKPIIQGNEVKIDIAHPESSDNNEDEKEDIFDDLVKVTIEGDVEGCKHAKAQIMDIVKEETKNMPINLSVDPMILPFVSHILKDIPGKFEELDISIPERNDNSSKIRLYGDREAVLKARNDIKNLLDKTADKITVEEVAIPKLKQKFLPIDEILEEENILIRLPKNEEGNVEFVGELKKIPIAIERARKTTSQYQVDILDMSKAHKGNLLHVRAVAALLESNGTFKKIADENNVLINVPSSIELANTNVKSIPLEVTFKNDELERVKNAKRSIVSAVNSISPDSTKIISDIDEFLLSKVPGVIDESAAENSISYVILGRYITLFSAAEEDDIDFVDEASSSNALDDIDNLLNQLRDMSQNLQSTVLSIEANDQAHISGPSGRTLSLIMKRIEPDSVMIKFHFNGERRSENELFIQGLKSQTVIVIQSIERVLSDFKEFKDEYKTSFQVPTSILSRLIGKNGSNLNSLRKEYGIKIDVSENELDNKENDNKTEIRITGVKLNSDECANRIQQLSKKWSDETLVRLKVDSQFHRRLIGPHGVYINRLQEKYKVNIRFPSSVSLESSYPDAPKSKDEVTIKGPSKAVSKAEEELMDFYHYEKENGHKQSVKIPTKAIARVIGRSGETIKDLADGTGIDYRFNRSKEFEEENGYAEVELTGSKSALKMAVKKIQDIIDEVENTTSISISVDPKFHRDLVGPGGSVMKEIISKAGGDGYSGIRYNRLLTVPNEGTGSNQVSSQGNKDVVDKIIAQVRDIVANKEAELIVNYELPKEKHRLIIGPSGSIRHSLQDEFNVFIDVPRPNDLSTTIKLKGRKEKIDSLIEKLNILTKDNWTASVDVPEAYHSFVSERGAVFKKLKSKFNIEIQHGNMTRRAAKLSSSSVPSPPEAAHPHEEENFKFSTIPLEQETDTSKVIPWRVKGESVDSDNALRVIKERLENAKKADTIGWIYVKKPSDLSKIVGTQGSTLDRIRNETGCSIFVPRPNDKNPNFIHLIGSQDSVSSAKGAIEKLIS